MATSTMFCGAFLFIFLAVSSTVSSAGVPVDGGWTPYGGWGACSRSCGGGSQLRSRSCTNPVPQYGGQVCTGSSTQIRDCETQPCEKYVKYGPWSTCTKSCAGGTQQRAQSPGSSVQTRTCEPQPCPVNGMWGQWQSWTACSGGIKTRSRSCNSPAAANGGRDCPGYKSQDSRC